MQLRRAVLMVGIAMISACGSSTAPLGTDGVAAGKQGERVAVTNGRTAPVFAFVIGRNASASADWLPCTNAEVCPPVQAGETKQFNPIISLAGEREVLVYWWHAVDSPTGRKPDSIRTIVVPW